MPELQSDLMVAPGAVILAWGYLANQWSSEPEKVGTATSPVAGDVYAYTLAGVTRFRLVPGAYVSGDDAFYASFADGICAGFIASRGQ
jgi:hypothetical protein